MQAGYSAQIADIKEQLANQISKSTSSQHRSHGVVRNVSLGFGSASFGMPLPDRHGKSFLIFIINLRFLINSIYYIHREPLYFGDRAPQANRKLRGFYGI